jgi:hypothetical protein
VRAVMVRYRVKSGRADENAALVRAVYEELTELRPPGFRYATFQLADGLGFVHLSLSEDGSNPLPGLAAFQAFTAAIGERCDEPPATSELTPVASYGFGIP